jgi:chromatin segregation and condensation protein Rec8/ScpA/Scc1 (kleisin family)
MAALHQALEVKRRRVVRSIPPSSMTIPEKHLDIGLMITTLYDRITHFFSKNPGNSLKFTQLIPSDKKRDKVLTFIPLLHLTNQRKIDLDQKEHFGEIEVILRTQELIDKELKDDKEAEEPIQPKLPKAPRRAPSKSQPADAA